MNFLTSNDPLTKGLRTFVQSIFGFVVGLVAVVWGVPGVPEAVGNYLAQHVVELLTWAGVSAGAVAWLMNTLVELKKK